ncbi:MAG: glycosyltransferase [Candidatus Aminicenantes bacterium]|nr:glycosyltransferase [Candidatus Aminicenantes bacterium]NIM84225.1 glycosyltransferase [Candidatus Aminicenantes bacterium]NIN23674.1 glycosyltransferase [Candidatus Aminicenantes bacterium]NIN47381.1 glycosyltransferase [Candidatus Aminicenantes bacterium]NIN90309.1 glycosyltransferase [Candidatus Aminicenantes bacterium]
MDTKTSFLHICSSFKIGGITSFVKAVLELNPTSGTRHDLVVLFENQVVEIAGTRAYCLGKFAANPFKIFFAFRKIIKNYQAIMLHKAHPVVVFPLLFKRKKIFIFQHGMTVSRGSVIKRRIKKIWYSLIPLLLKAKVVCSTEFAYGKSRKAGILFSKKHLVVIPFGIKINRRIKQANNQKEARGKIFVGSAGILSKIKRFDLLIKSLINYTGKLNINLKIVGEGPEKESLLKLAAGITNKNVTVEFPGHIEDMIPFYDSLDLFVFPSHNESFGLVVLEALSRGVPVALFPDAGGALPLIQDNRNGFVLKHGIGGLEELWVKLDKNLFILMDMVEYINKMDLSPYNIKTTRLKLENLANQV